MTGYVLGGFAALAGGAGFWWAAERWGRALGWWRRMGGLPAHPRLARAPGHLSALVERWPWPARPPADTDLILLLRRAGWHRWAPEDLMGWACRALGLASWTGAAAGALVTFLATAAGSRTLGLLLLPVVGYLGGRRIFLTALAAAGRRRANQVRRGMPGWLEDIALAARGGLSLRQAVEVANDVGEGPLIEDARDAFARIRAGQPLRLPLLELAQLYPEPEVTVALRTLVEAEARGLPLAQTLDEQVRLMRALAARQWQRQADSLPFWLTVITMGLLLPPVLVVVLLPNVIQFLRLYH